MSKIDERLNLQAVLGNEHAGSNGENNGAADQSQPQANNSGFGAGSDGGADDADLAL